MFEETKRTAQLSAALMARRGSRCPRCISKRDLKLLGDGILLRWGPLHFFEALRLESNPKPDEHTMTINFNILDVTNHYTFVNVMEAADLANKLVRDSSFYNLIAAKQGGFDRRFTSPNLTPSILASVLSTTPINMNIRLGSARRKVLGWTYPSDPNTVWLNIKRLERDPVDIARTLIHEWVHAVDSLCVDYYFHHGTNDPSGKGNSAPYWIDGLAGRQLNILAGSIDKSLGLSKDFSQPLVDVLMPDNDSEFIELASYSDIDPKEEDQNLGQA